MAQTHTDKAYEAELTGLRDRLLEMGGLVEQAIAASVRAITERDSALAEQVKTRDREINRMEVEIDATCLRILALRQPAASDLRFIATALKIAERAIDLNQAPALAPLHDLTKLADLSEAQLKRALDAFVARDVSKAEEVMQGDELLDALYLKIFNDLLTLMMEDSRAIRRATSLMFAAKYLERFGDHATNLGEMVVYMVRGTDVRHPRSRVV